MCICFFTFPEYELFHLSYSETVLNLKLHITIKYNQSVLHRRPPLSLRCHCLKSIQLYARCQISQRIWKRRQGEACTSSSCSLGPGKTIGTRWFEIWTECSYSLSLDLWHITPIHVLVFTSKYYFVTCMCVWCPHRFRFRYFFWQLKHIYAPARMVCHLALGLQLTNHSLGRPPFPGCNCGKWRFGLGFRTEKGGIPL